MGANIWYWKHTIIKSPTNFHNKYIVKFYEHSLTTTTYGLVEHYEESYVSLRESIVIFASNLGAHTNSTKHLSQASHDFYIYTFYTIYSLYALSASYGYYPITSEAYVSPKL